MSWVQHRSKPLMKMERWTSASTATFSLLAVTNDQIRPPITIQNRSNKQTFDKYAFTIDLVPLVLEELYFVGQSFKYNWKTKQNAQSRKCNADPT